MGGIAINPRLDLFTEPPVNYTNTNYAVTVTNPVTVPAGDAPITFIIQSDSNFLNFKESILRFKINITGAGGVALVANQDNHVNFIPNIFHSLFKMVRMRVNGYPVTPSSDLYCYKAFFDTLFASTKDSAFSDLLTGFDPDLGVEDAVAAEDNPAWLRRAALVNRSVLTEYSGELAVDFLRSSRNVLPNTKIEITLFPQPPSFVIQHDNDANVRGIALQYHIQDCQFLVRRETVESTALLAIETRLSKDFASYYYPLGAVKPYFLPAGIFNFRAEDVFTNHLPQKILVAFVRSTAFNGTYLTNPLFFNPSEAIEHVEFFKNGVRLGLQQTMPIDLRAAGTDKHIAYRELNKAVNGSRNNIGLPFSLASFRQGYFFAALDLTPDGQDDLAHRYPTEQGSISIHVKLREALPHGIEMLPYGVFQEKSDINKSRAVVSSVNV